jgi:signal peptidase
VRGADRTLSGIAGLFAAWVVVGLVAAALGPALIGWTPHVVTSGSMNPAVIRGDVVVTDWVDGRHLRPGQVALFDTGTGPTVHRVVEVLPDGTYLTRGDANASVDSTPVAPNQVRGVVRMVVPLVGRLALLREESAGFRILALGTLGLVAFAVFDARSRRRIRGAW